MSGIDFHRVSLSYPIREHASFSLKDTLLKSVFRTAPRQMQSVHALKEVTVNIQDKERVGIIGHNGAGKSTLLRTMGGVYPITSGRRDVEGTICSLFDIVCGFETNATGKQNIFYRCYLQGETPAMVKEKIDDIIEFSELGEFIHVPVRCYSTGMLMRLAFAIVTSGDPDILLIDEVFATGDRSFHNKAKARIDAFVQKANIVVIVGHDLNTIADLCDRVLWMEQGQVRMDGEADEVIAAYTDKASALRAA